jgi:DNA mismatch endonuclease (patch repair protein)
LHARQPRTNSEFWFAKIGRNKERDQEVAKLLKLSGWTVLRYWEHEVRDEITRVVSAISKAVRNANAQTGRKRCLDAARS